MLRRLSRYLSDMFQRRERDWRTGVPLPYLLKQLDAKRAKRPLKRGRLRLVVRLERAS